MSLPAHGTVCRWPARSETFAPGRYLTDGRRLFRVVAQFNPGRREVLASLEDCLTLEVSAYTPDDLYAMELRSVEA